MRFQELLGSEGLEGLNLIVFKKAVFQSRSINKKAHPKGRVCFKEN
jgi:hypothetical protein